MNSSYYYVVRQAGQEGFDERLGLLDELARRLENGRLVRLQHDVHVHDEQASVGVRVELDGQLDVVE